MGDAAKQLPVLQSVRASALPLGLKCPGSLRAEMPIDPHNEAGSAGTAAHKCLEDVPFRGDVRWSQVGKTAALYGADETEVRVLCSMALRLWEQVAESFAGASPEPSMEAEVVPGVMLTGHVDLLTINDRVARAGDWKTGRKDSDYAAQMRAYAVLILLRYPELEEVTVTVLWVRDQEIENYTMRRPEARRWLEQLWEKVINWDGVFHPGSHCQFCKRWHECEGAAAYVRRDVQAIAGKELVARAESELDKMTPDEVIGLYEQADMVEKLAKRVRDAIRERAVHGGDIEGETRRITVSTETRRELDAEKAWPLLEASGFDDEDFAAVIKLSVSKVEKRVAQKAGRGKGASAVRALAGELAEAGAVKTRELHKVQVKRK